MTRSRLEETRRAIADAARSAAVSDPGLENVTDIIEAIELRMGWDLDTEEKHVAVAAYRIAQREAPRVVHAPDCDLDDDCSCDPKEADRG